MNRKNAAHNGAANQYRRIDDSAHREHDAMLLAMLLASLQHTSSRGLSIKHDAIPGIVAALQSAIEQHHGDGA
jgi:hypothetical protein